LAIENPEFSNTRAARTRRAIARYRFGAGTPARKNRLIIVLGKTPKSRANIRTFPMRGGQRKSVSKNRQQSSGAPARSTES